MREIKIQDDELSLGNILIIEEALIPALGLRGRIRTSQVVLAKYVQTSRQDLLCKRIADIRCGTGTVGLFLQKLGAKVSLWEVEQGQGLIKGNMELNNSKAEFGTWRADHEIEESIKIYAQYLEQQNLQKQLKQVATSLKQESLLAFRKDLFPTAQVAKRLSDLEVNCQEVGLEDYHPYYSDERIAILSVFR